MVVLRPCAKVNLTLRVGAARDDGFHEVDTLLQSILLSDRLTFVRRGGPFVLATRARDVPADRSNLVWRAAELLWRAIGNDGEPRGARVTLEKKIPVAAGLGGGSADAAAALVGLNSVWRSGLALADLTGLASKLGADVPFFLHGGTAVGTGRGDVVDPVEDLPRLPLVVVTPAFGVSAADAYRWLDEDRRETGASASVRRGRDVVDVGWTRGPLALVNDLEAPVRRRHPEVDHILETFRREKALAAAMTGSGSAVFGLFWTRPGPAAIGRFRRHGWRVVQTRTATRREASLRLSV